MKQVNTLITGASGFLGGILKDALKAKGAKVTGQGRSKQEIQFDISSPFSFPEGSGFDVVIHAAGKAHSVPSTPEEENVFYQVNLEGTKNLCTAVDQLPGKPNSFIFISTVAVYGLNSGECIKETQALNGTTPYAHSKILAEEWLKRWAEERGICLGILRLPLVAGPLPPGNLGAMIKGIQNGKYLSIGRASSRKSVVWAEDIAKIIPKLAEVGGIYNLSDGQHPTFKELEVAIAQSLGKNSPYKVPIWLAKGLGNIGDVIGNKFPINSDKLHKITSTLTFDDNSARRVLGWKPSLVLDRVPEMVKEFKS